MKKKNKTAFRIGLACGILSLVIFWIVVSNIVDAPLIFPKPAAVFKRLAFLLTQKSFYISMLHTTLRCAVAFALSLVFGFAGGYLSGKFPSFDGFTKPVLQIIKSVPVVAIILICLFFMNSSVLASFIAFLMALPVVWDACQKGFSCVQERKLKWCKLHGISRTGIFFFVELEEVKPFLKAGCRSASSMVWKVCAAGEVLSLPRKALGSLLSRSQISLESADTFAITICIVVLSFVFAFALWIFLLLVEKLYRLVLKRIFKQHDDVENFQKGRVLKQCHAVQNPPQIKIHSLTICRDKKIFSNLSCVFEERQINFVFAPSGFGKTTLLDCISGMINSSNDELVIEGTFTKVEHISYLLQKPILMEGLTVTQNLLLADSTSNVAQLLQRFQLSARANAFPSQLSGGQRQLVAFLQSLLFDSQLLLLDEPFKSIDENRRLEMQKILLEFQEKMPRTVILVSHDKSDMDKLGGRMVLEL